MGQKLSVISRTLATLEIRHVACNLDGPDASLAVLTCANTAYFSHVSRLVHDFIVLF